MSSNNCCSENHSSSSLGNSGHTPVTAPTDVSGGDAPCSSGGSLDSNTLEDKCPDPNSKHTNCQSSNFGRIACSPSRSRGSSFCNSESCRHLLNVQVPSYQFYGYQPLRYLTFGRQPPSYLGYDRQPLRYLRYGCQPLSCMSDYPRPSNYACSNFQPHFSSFSAWRYPY